MSFAPGHWTMSPRGRGYRSSGDTGEAGGGRGVRREPQEVSLTVITLLLSLARCSSDLGEMGGGSLLRGPGLQE